jgi:hypothetical protein
LLSTGLGQLLPRGLRQRAKPPRELPLQQRGRPFLAALLKAPLEASLQTLFQTLFQPLLPALIHE